MVPLMLLLGVLACDSSSEAPLAAATEKAAAKADAPIAESDANEDLAKEADTTRMVIRTGRLELRTDAVEEVAGELGDLADRFGGYVERSDGSAAGDAFRNYEAALRIPGDRFDRAMAELRTRGEVMREHVDSTDVTQNYSDVKAQLRSHNTLETRLLGLLENTTSVEDALRVESELVRVRSTIETLEGRRKVMERQVAMATIEVVLVHPDPPRAPEAHSAMTRIGDATEDARNLFVDVIAGLIRIFGAVLPILLIGGPVAFAAHRGLRRKQSTPPQS